MGFRCVAEDGVVLIENMFHFTAETMGTKGAGQMLGGVYGYLCLQLLPNICIGSSALTHIPFFSPALVQTRKI